MRRSRPRVSDDFLISGPSSPETQSSNQAEVEGMYEGLRHALQLFGSAIESVTVVGQILQKVDGVTHKCDREAGTISITAKDKGSAQKALDALAAGGFHGDTGNKDLAIKDDSGVAKGKVKTLTLSGAHNCCGACCRGIKATVKKVDGVTGDTAKPKGETFEVTGDFDAEELVKALNAAGFHVKVKN